MKRESGNRNSSIWLIGDSSPPSWEDYLDEPLDAKHPARHNIWTPIIDRIQRQVFISDQRRVDDSQLYVRNAVHNQKDKPDYGTTEWCPKLLAEADDFGKLLKKHKPPLVFTFGAFAFEFARRSISKGPNRRQSYWDTKKLGAEFGQRVENFNPQKINIFPLLHVSIARGHFLKSHKNFTGEDNGNYFYFVAEKIGHLLLKHKCTLNIWIEP